MGGGTLDIPGQYVMCLIKLSITDRILEAILILAK